MNIIDFFVYIPNRAQFVLAMTTTLLPDGRPICTLSNDGEDRLIPVQGVILDEIGAVVKKLPVFDADDVEITPAEIIDGHHVNIRVYGEIAAMLTDGMPTEGDVFQRTRILSLIPGMVFVPAMNNGVPYGYVGPNNVRLFDPALVATPNRVWM